MTHKWILLFRGKGECKGRELSAFIQVLSSSKSALSIKPHLSRPKISYRKSPQQLKYWHQLESRPLKIKFNLPPYTWGKCCPEKESALANITQYVHGRAETWQLASCGCFTVSPSPTILPKSLINSTILAVGLLSRPLQNPPQP